MSYDFGRFDFDWFCPNCKRVNTVCRPLESGVIVKCENDKCNHEYEIRFLIQE